MCSNLCFPPGEWGSSREASSKLQQSLGFCDPCAALPKVLQPSQTPHTSWDWAVTCGTFPQPTQMLINPVPGKGILHVPSTVKLLTEGTTHAQVKCPKQELGQSWNEIGATGSDVWGSCSRAIPKTKCFVPVFSVYSRHNHAFVHECFKRKQKSKYIPSDDA